MPTISAASRHDLSDAQWAVLEPLLPAPSLRGVRAGGRCGLVDGVRHRTRTGCPWRDVPERYGRWWRVYALFACWQLLGVWEQIESALIVTADAAGELSWQVSVDSTTSRAHVHAAGARRESVDLVAGEPDHHALGRTTPEEVLADKAYSSRADRAWLSSRGIRATIPVPGRPSPTPQQPRPTRRGPPAFDVDRYKDRHAVECGINILKHHRGFATRYDKLAVRFAATVRVAIIDHWLRRLT